MRALWLATVLLVAGCWSRDDFRSQCILAGNCQLDDVDAGFDGGLEVKRWEDVAAFLFDGVDGGDSSFDVSFVSNRTASFRPTGNECGFVAGVLTTSGSVICAPVDVLPAVEVLPDGTTSGVSITRTNGAQWGGAVLFDNGKVFAAPTTGSEWLAITEPIPGNPRGFDLIPVSAGSAPMTGLARTPDGVVVAPARGQAVIFRSDGGATALTGEDGGVEFAGTLLLPSGKVLFVPRSASQVVEVTVRGTTGLDRVTPRGRFTGLAGGLLLESGDALLTPAVSGGAFVRVPADGGLPTSLTTPSRTSLFSATWSTNGYAYGLDVDGGSAQVAVIDRRGAVTWQQLPSSALDAGLFGPLSHVGLTAMPDGRLVSCGCRSANAMILTPHTRRTLPIEVMTSPWLNKW